MSRTRIYVAAACLAVLALLTTAATAEELRNDGWENGLSVQFQGGFVAGEYGAVRLAPSAPGTYPLLNVTLLFGGDTSVHDVVLHIWDDSAETLAPGAELFSGTYQLQGANDAMNQIDLSGEGLTVSGPIRVGVEFTHSGYPSIARDTDGTISTLRNFIYTGGTWYRSSVFGLTGDWIIRANTGAAAALYSVGGTVSGLTGTLTLQNNGGDDLTVTADGPFVFATQLDDGAAYDVTVLSSPPGQTFAVVNGSGTIAGADVTDVLVAPVGSAVDVLQNDGWSDGASAGFQGGFVSGEIAAARLSPAGGTWDLDAVQLLFGGATTAEFVTLKIWDDTGGADAPGAELFSADYQLTGGDYLQQIDLTPEGLSVSGDFRVGLLFQNSGYPSVARDDDGNITPDRNFIYTGGAWYESSLLGLTGDWVLRAVVSQQGAAAPATITAVTDLPHDQGRQVRLAWNRDSRDDSGSPTPVTGYAIFRRIDPGYRASASDAAADKSYPPGNWEYLSTVPAFQEAVYAAVAPTVADSTIADGMHYTAFFVRATTAQPGVYFDSAPDSGWSVDNLVPQTPQGFAVAYDAVDGNVLSWQESTDADFDYFKIYCGDAPDFPVDPGAPCLTTTSTTWTDAGGGYGTWYRVASVDFSGNESAPTDPSDTQLTGADPIPAAALALHPARPNPFNPSTEIEFDLPRAMRARLEIFDAQGRCVRRLVDAQLEPGPHRAVWSGRDDAGRALPAGLYLARLRAGAESAVRKLSLIK